MAPIALVLGVVAYVMYDGKRYTNKHAGKKQPWWSLPAGGGLAYA